MTLTQNFFTTFMFTENLYYVLYTLEIKFIV